MSELVLVTGGTGYVAGWCIVELLQQGYRVRTTVRSAARAQAVREAVGTRADPSGIEFAVADLTADNGWESGLAGVDRVLHVAASLGGERAGEDLIGPARDGALRVLRAATAAGVRRVVMTSAANAASPSDYADDGVTDETLWTDPEAPGLIPYRRAKTLAELAAWEFMNGRDGTELTTILPGAVLGPVLDAASVGTSGIVARMLGGGMPAVPRIALEVVDVRDLADVHVRALIAPEAAGQRFLATGELLWMRELASVLREGLGPAAAKVPTRQLPDFAVRLVARFADPSLRALVPGLGRRNRHSTAKAERLLGWKPRPAAQTVLDCGRSLIEVGAVRT